MDRFVGFLVPGVLVCITSIIVIIFLWEICKLFLIDFYSRKQTIEDVKENIIDCLEKADGLGYETIFRTPECVAYKNCHLHVATTKNGKEIIIVDLIGEKEHIKLLK